MARMANSAAWHFLCNLLIIVLCCLPGMILEYAFNDPTVPFQRGIYCNDDSIRYPHRENTVSSELAVALSLGIPFVGMVIVEWLLFRRYKALGDFSRDVPMYRGTKILCVRIHSYIVALVSAYIPFLFAAVATLSLTNILKFMVGRLRPHFLDVCRPNATALQLLCTGSNGFSTYVEEVPCSADANSDDLLDARLSFPSGHSSGAAVCFIYFSIYLHYRMVWKGPFLLRPFLQFLVITGAVMISASRIADYKHFWSDVLFGFVMGAIIGILVAFFVSDLYFFETPSVITSSPSSKEFNTSPSDTDLSAIVTIPASFHSTNSSQFGKSEKIKPTNI